MFTLVITVTRESCCLVDCKSDVKQQQVNKKAAKVSAESFSFHTSVINSITVKRQGCERQYCCCCFTNVENHTTCGSRFVFLELLND